MLFGADPHMAIAPFAQFPQLLDLGVAVLDVVLLGQAGGIVDANIASEAEKDAGGLIRQQLRERSRECLLVPWK